MPTTSRTNKKVGCVRDKVRSDLLLAVRMIANKLSDEVRGCGRSSGKIWGRKKFVNGIKVAE